MFKRQTMVMAAAMAVLLVAGQTLMAADKEEKAYGLKVGDQAPAFTTLNQKSEKVSLGEELKKGPLVLVFYRGAWCPYCNKHLKEIQGAMDGITATGAQVLAVSVDVPEKEQGTVEKHRLDFDILSDPEAKLLDAYNVRYQVDKGTQKKYKKFGIDLEAHSGREDGVIAVPAVYVIDMEGIIRFAYANEDYKVRAVPEDFLPVLKKLDRKS